VHGVRDSGRIAATGASDETSPVPSAPHDHALDASLATRRMRQSAMAQGSTHNWPVARTSSVSATRTDDPARSIRKPHSRSGSPVASGNWTMPAVRRRTATCRHDWRIEASRRTSAPSMRNRIVAAERPSGLITAGRRRPCTCPSRLVL